jgi:hypothetical protein
MANVRSWGERTIVDLDWRGPKMFSANRVPGTIPGYKGVYLITSRKATYSYPRGRSSIAYIGSGSVGDRLSSHVDENERVQNLLDKEGTLRFWWARVGYGSHDCVEQTLFDDFQERHGGRPIINMRRPPCSREYDSFRVRHSGLAYPHYFSSSAQF